jgi:hypothetical protein
MKTHIKRFISDDYDSHLGQTLNDIWQVLYKYEDKLLKDLDIWMSTIPGIKIISIIPELHANRDVSASNWSELTVVYQSKE